MTVCSFLNQAHIIRRFLCGIPIGLHTPLLYDFFLIPKRVPGMINSLLDYQKVQGHLPVWTLWDKETYCMIANHAVPVRCRCRFQRI